MNQNFKNSTLAVLAEDIAKLNYYGIYTEETLNNITPETDSAFGELFDIVLNDGSILNNIKIDISFDPFADENYSGYVSLVYIDEDGNYDVFEDTTEFFTGFDWSHICAFNAWLEENLSEITEELGFMIEKYVA